MSYLPNKAEFSRLENIVKDKIFRSTIDISDDSLRRKVEEFIESDNCEEWQVFLMIWFYRYIKNINKDLKKEKIKKLLNASLDTIKSENVGYQNAQMLNSSSIERKANINGLLLGVLETIKKDDPFVQPSLENCLSKEEKKYIEDEVNFLEDSTIIPESEVIDSPQMKLLEKYQHIPGFSKYLHQLSFLIEKSQSNQNDKYQASAALKYFLKKDDLIPDSEGILGLVDDLYAINFSFKQLNPNKEFYDLVKIHDENFSGFSLPGVGETENILPLTNLEDLIKASYTSTDNSKPIKRLIVTREIGPLGLLISIGKSITDRLKASRKSNELESFKNGDKLNLGFKTSAKGTKTKINVKYDRKSGSDFYVKDKNNQTIKLNNDDLRYASKINEDFKLSTKKTVEEWMDPTKEFNQSFLWDRLFFNKSVKKLKSNGKILLISKKTELEPFLREFIYGEELISWFGMKGFKKNNDFDVENPFPQQLFPEAQIIIASSITQVNKALRLHNENEDFNLDLVVCAYSNLLLNDTLRINLLNNDIDTILLSEVYKNDLNTQLQKENYELLVGSHDEYIPIDVEKKGPFGSFLIRTLKPNIDVVQMKNDPMLERLDKLRKFRRIFGQADPYLRLNYCRLVHFLGQQLFVLEGDEKEKFEEDFDFLLQDLEHEAKFDDKYEEVCKFLKTNKLSILQTSRQSHLEEYLDKYSSEEFHLICRTSQKEKISNRLKERYPNLKVLSKPDLDSSGFLKNLIVPYFWGRDISTKLRNYHYAENHIFFLTKEEFKVHKKMEKIEKKFFSNEFDSSEKEVKLEISENLDELIHDIDPFFSLLEDTKKIIGKEYSTNLKENIPSNLFFLEGEKVYLSPEKGDTLSFSKEDKKINYDRSELLKPGDKLIIKEGIHGDYLLDASLEDDHEKYSIYQEVKHEAKFWIDSLERFKNENNLDDENLTNMLAEKGVKRKVQTVRNWLQDKETLRPQSLSEIEKILDLTGDYAHSENCQNSIQKVENLRKEARKNLNSLLEKYELEENDKEFDLQIGSKEFKFSIYEIQATEKVQIDRRYLYKVEKLDEILRGFRKDERSS